MRDFDPTAGEFAGHDAIHVTSRHYDFGSILGAGVSLLGGAMGADGAEDAAASQLQGTRESNALQKEMFDKNIELQMPSINAGNLSRNKLLYLMGLSANGTSAPQLTREQIRKQLIDSGAYASPAAAQPAQSNELLNPLAMLQRGPQGPQNVTATAVRGPNGEVQYEYGVGGAVTPAGGGLDEARLNADIERRLAEQQAAMQAANTGAESDPAYGSLLRNFSLADFQKDPGYEFRLAEGEKGINRSMAGRGSFDSGAALKALQRFGQDYASNEFGNAYNRFENNKTGTYNKLAGLSGSGQQAATTLGNQGTQYGQYVGNNITANANAQGAAQIAGANSWGNALSGAVNNYQQQNFQNSLMRNLNNYGANNRYMYSNYGSGD